MGNEVILPREPIMQKIYFDKILRAAVQLDIEKHITICISKGNHNIPWACTESLKLLKSNLNDLSDEQIEDEIQVRNKKLKQKNETRSIEDYYLNMELLVFRRLQRDLYKSFPNSFPINRKFE